MAKGTLVFEVPASWKRNDRGTFIEYTVADDVSVVVPPIVPLPEDVWFWAGAPERDLPRAARSVKVTNRTERLTALEWSITVVDSVALSADEAVVESRVHVLISLLEHAVIVAVRAPSNEALAACRAEILAALDTMHPLWDPSPAASLQALLQG